MALAAVLGPLALLFWLVQSAYAVFLLEVINYIEHYGLQRRVIGGRPGPSLRKARNSRRKARFTAMELQRG